ncbi:rCG44800, isoform CRA_a [Rattus norvegicus]|uniref:RCG44800, isoform CRA_a n=1 Tax=Rattus norvegicus TaxID=10116 RepID=A6I5I4_RAT|nr:rCG44800, isoform CRA_a [Rattus norvegicus]EDM10293.1 rCG44800, isoform CRA_a [Rattus norvegicus]
MNQQVQFNPEETSRLPNWARVCGRNLRRSSLVNFSLQSTTSEVQQHNIRGSTHVCPQRRLANQYLSPQCLWGRIYIPSKHHVSFHVSAIAKTSFHLCAQQNIIQCNQIVHFSGE